jgi:hypothetical protein
MNNELEELENTSRDQMPLRSLSSSIIGGSVKITQFYRHTGRIHG